METIAHTTAAAFFEPKVDCVQDISAGLAYSVVKNVLYKVIKLADAKELGTHVVVQGGTFHNKAVLRAFEMLTVSTFDGRRRHITGIPRVLNMYENYPFWATLLKELGFSVVLSPLSSRSIYELGMDSIPSESECYPAKLAHGHIQWLINQGIETILYPSVFYEHQEDPAAQNNYNCPMVIANPENIGNNVEDIQTGRAHLLKPFLALTSAKTAADNLSAFFKGISIFP